MDTSSEKKWIIKLKLTIEDEFRKLIFGPYYDQCINGKGITPEQLKNRLAYFSGSGCLEGCSLTDLLFICNMKDNDRKSSCLPETDIMAQYRCVSKFVLDQCSKSQDPLAPASLKSCQLPPQQSPQQFQLQQSLQPNQINPVQACAPTLPETIKVVLAGIMTRCAELLKIQQRLNMLRTMIPFEAIATNCYNITLRISHYVQQAFRLIYQVLSLLHSASLAINSALLMLVSVRNRLSSFGLHIDPYNLGQKYYQDKEALFNRMRDVLLREQAFRENQLRQHQMAIEKFLPIQQISTFAPQPQPQLPSQQLIQTQQHLPSPRPPQQPILPQSLPFANEGNVCYANAMLQVLINQGLFHLNHQVCLKGAKKSTINKFITATGKVQGQQQDPVEYLQYMIGELGEKDEKQCLASIAALKTGKDVKHSVLHSVFVTHNVCEECKTEKISPECIAILPLKLNDCNKNGLASCIAAKERIDGVMCDVCKKPTSRNTFLKNDVPADFLFLQMWPSIGLGEKINSNVEMTTILDFGDRAKYTPVGAIIHIGKYINSGHYVAVVLENNRWMIYDDHHTPIPLPQDKLQNMFKKGTIAHDASVYVWCLKRVGSR